MLARNDKNSVQEIFGKPLLTHKVSIIVPSTQNHCIDGVKVTVEADPSIRGQVVSLVERNFVQAFGGASRTELQGLWLDATTNEIVAERGSEITAFTDALTIERLEVVNRIAKIVKTALAQDAVFVTIDNSAYLV